MPRLARGHVALGALLAYFVATSVRHVDVVPPVFEDEPWFASTGFKLATDGVFGSDVFTGFYGMERRYYAFMPVAPMLLAAAFRLFGFGLVQLRLESVALGAMTLALTYALGRRLFGHAVGVVAVAFLVLVRTDAVTRIAPTGILFLDAPRIGRYDMPTPVFGLAALLAYVSARDRGAARAGGLGRPRLEHELHAGLADVQRDALARVLDVDDVRARRRDGVQQRDERPRAVGHAGEQHEPAIVGRPAVGLVARAPEQDDRAGEDEHRQQEVAHDEPGPQLEDHGQPAEHRLRQHAERQQRGEDREVAAARRAAEAEQEGGDARDAHEAGHDAVAELDERVGLERRRDALAAARPVRAAQAGAGEPDGRAAEHDEEQQDERGEAHELVLARREDGQAGPHRQPRA